MLHLVTLTVWTLAQAPPAPVVLNDDGGWCWFQDERALVVGGRLVVGSVANGRHDPARKGDIDVTTYDLKTGAVDRVTLHRGLQADDHAAPALLARPDGRLLAVYTRHGNDANVYYRVTARPGDAATWGAERVFAPSPTTRVTYSNLVLLRDENGGRGRVYDFFRGLDDRFKPSWVFSDDQGESWTAGGLLVDVPSARRHRPYARYAGNGTDTAHVVFTEGHPRDFDNSLYHALLRDGWLCRSDGARIRRLADGPLRPDEATKIFAGDAANVAWAQDIHLDAAGRPVVVYSVQKDSEGLPPGQGGSDHRYRYARWDGRKWHDREVAFAGRRLYAGEDDYTGGIALDPDDVGRVFLSADVDPRTGKPLPGGRCEIFRGETPDRGKTWHWSAVTENSPGDNLRPLVPADGAPDRVPLLWLRGTYHSFTRYELEVVCQVLAGRGQTND